MFTKLAKATNREIKNLSPFVKELKEKLDTFKEIDYKIVMKCELKDEKPLFTNKEELTKLYKKWDSELCFVEGLNKLATL